MANKAAKQQASRNEAALRRMHLVSLAVFLGFVLVRLVLFRSSCTPTTYLVSALVSAPALAIEFWFERTARPQYAPATGELRRAGDDLAARGLTEYMFDVLYWTWATVVAAAVFGDYAWWLWAVVPLYSVWLAYTTFGSVRKGMAGLTGDGDGDGAAAGSSNRQRKMEKRGGQKIQYR